MTSRVSASTAGFGISTAVGSRKPRYFGDTR